MLVVVIDRNGIIMARTQSETQFIGKPVQRVKFLEAISGRDAGIYEARSLEGVACNAARSSGPA